MRETQQFSILPISIPPLIQLTDQYVIITVTKKFDTIPKWLCRDDRLGRGGENVGKKKNKVFATSPDVYVDAAVPGEYEEKRLACARFSNFGRIFGGKKTCQSSNKLIFVHRRDALCVEKEKKV